MGKKVLCGLFVAAVLGAGQADGFRLYGVLRGNDRALSVDSVLWALRGSPLPVWERTPGWEAESAGVDTFRFLIPEDWPFWVELFYTFVAGGPQHYRLDTLIADTWYDLPPPPGLPPSQPPQVKFVDSLMAGLEQRGARACGLGVVPNPSPGRVWLAGRLAEPGRVEVFDRAGRPVRRLLLLPGERVLVWDGRDQQGLRAGSGVYFLELVSAGRRRWAKVTLARE